MHVDPRHLVDAQHPVVPEVGLLNPARHDRDLAPERSRQAENDSALHLRANGVGIDLNAAIDDAPDTSRIDGSLPVHADLHELLPVTNYKLRVRHRDSSGVAAVATVYTGTEFVGETVRRAEREARRWVDEQTAGAS